MTMTPDTAPKKQETQDEQLSLGGFLRQLELGYKEALEDVKDKTDRSISGHIRNMLFMVSRFAEFLDPMALDPMALDLMALMEYKPSSEVRKKIIELIGRDSESELVILAGKIIYLKHPIQAVVDQVSLVADLITEALKHD